MSFDDVTAEEVRRAVLAVVEEMEASVAPGREMPPSSGFDWGDHREWLLDYARRLREAVGT